MEWNGTIIHVFVTSVLFLLCQVKIHAVKKASTVQRGSQTAFKPQDNNP